MSAMLNSQATDDNEIFELSPFVVETQEGTYVATSTLAGSRIRTDVADLGSSISILTPQLLEDVGGTDAGSVLSVVPNIEVAGELGNFSSARIRENSYAADESRESLNVSQRVRGLASAQSTRNYFQTIIPFDTYNTSQVTVNRGPNSVLFGLGSPGGVIENSISMPVPKDLTKLQFRLDTYGGHRESIDVNRSYYNNRLNVRIALLNEDKKYRQEEAMEEDQRAFLALSYKLRDAEQNAFLGDTTIRGYVESGDINRISPDPIPPTVHYQFWYDISDYQNIVGNYPGFDSIDDIEQPFFKTIAQGGLWEKQSTIVNTDRATYDRQRLLTPAFIALAQYYDSPSATEPGIMGYNGLMPRIRWGGSRGTQDHKFTFGDYSLAGFSGKTLDNRDVFDFVKHLYYGDTDVYTDDFSVQELTLDQELLGGKMGVEIAYNNQEIDNFRFSPYSDGRSRRIMIDVSEQISLPAEVPTAPKDTSVSVLENPNIGRPAMAVNNFRRSMVERELETFRATAYFRHDFNDNFDNLFGKILGNHTLSALYQDFSDHRVRLEEGLNWDSDEVDLGQKNILNSGYNRQRRNAQTLVYIGDSVLGTSSMDQVRLDLPLSKSVIPVAGEMNRFTYWDNGKKQVLEVNAYGSWIPVVGSSTIAEQQVESDAFILQSNWLDNHLVTLFAVRNDTVRNFEIIPEGNTPLPDNSFDLNTLVLQDTPSFEQSAETITKSVVLRFPEQYLFELPFGADLRFHYFESETFQPSSIGRQLDGSIVSNPNGTTEEYGFSVDLLERRLSLRASWYETGSNDARIGTALGALNNWAGSGGTWLTRAAEFEITGAAVTDIPGNEDGHIASWEELYDKIENITPQYFRDQISVDFDRDGASVTGVPIDGLTSTYDFVSKGMELEIAGAITNNWNIIFNVAKQETVQSNTLPGVLEFAEEVERNLVSSGLSSLMDSPANAGFPTTYSIRWENNVLFPIRSEQAKDGQKTPEQRKWRWNLITSYRFDDGFMKNWTIGGVARWQDEAAVGYPVITNADGNLVNDIQNPWFGPTEFNADLWVAYEKKIGKNNSIDWKIQLNVRNLIGGSENEFIPISINPIGEVQAIRTSPERQIFLTNTFRF